MSSHCTGVTLVLEWKRMGHNLKIGWEFLHSFIYKKIIIDPRFALEGNDFSSGMYLLSGEKIVHRINMGKFCEDIEDKDW